MANPVGNLVNFDTSKLLAQASSFIEIVFVMVIVGVVMYLIIYWMRYKHPVYLFMEEGKGTKIVKDRGYAKKKDRVFKLLKNKEIDCDYPESKYFYRQGKSSALAAFVRNQSAAWLTITDNPHFIPANINMQNHLLNDIQGTWEIIKPKESFWAVYGQQVLWGMSMGVFLVVIILVLQRMDRIIELAHSVTSLAQSQGKQVIEVLMPVSMMRKREK